MPALHNYRLPLLRGFTRIRSGDTRVCLDNQRRRLPSSCHAKSVRVSRTTVPSGNATLISCGRSVYLINPVQIS
jgi:hypothetical protein